MHADMCAGIPVYPCMGMHADMAVHAGMDVHMRAGAYMHAGVCLQSVHICMQ